MHRRLRVTIAGLVAAAAIGACTPSDQADKADKADKAGPAGGPATEVTSPATATTDTNQSPTPSKDASTPPPFEPRTVTVVMNGDMLLHEGLWATAQIDARRTGSGAMDFRPLLSDMKPVVAGADLAICHMETPLAPAGGPYSGYPVFSAPPAIVPALEWAGYDACTTASNHSIDQGFDGLSRTIADFDRAGIEHTGTATTKRASRQPLLLDAHGVTVALVSATYGTNGIPLPSEQPWSVNLIKTDRILRLAHRARAEGADVVMVALHWGLEYMHAPTSDQLAVADRLTKSPDIDLIYGHHAHVVQPYDRVNGTWVVYGLGNAVAQQSTTVEGVYDGNTARVTFVERKAGGFRVAKIEYIPTMITPFDGVHPMRMLNVPASLDDPDKAGLHDALQATFDRVTAVVDLEHALRQGVVLGQ